MSGALSGTVLVTGGSGVLGAALLRELADLDVVALQHRKPLPPGRHGVVTGSVVEPRLGLDDATYSDLIGRVSCVIHSAAITNWGASRAQFEAVNVHGTAEALAFARDAGALLVQVSTALPMEFVVPDDASPSRRRGRVTLERYLRSKHAGDELVSTSGQRVLLARPTWIVGDGETGETAGFQGIHALGRHLLKGDVPILPVPADGTLDFLPQDVIARVMRFAIEDGFAGEDLWVTAGEEGMPVAEGLAILAEFTRQAGVPFDPPRIVAPDVMDRLIRPVLLPALPIRAQRRFEFIWEITRPLLAGFQSKSSLPALRARGLELELDLGAALRATLGYWIETTELARVPG